MSKASGFVLILAGLAAAAYVLPSGGEVGEPDFGQFADIAKVPQADVTNQVVVVAPEPKPAVRPAPVAAQSAPSFSTPVVVTLAQRANEQAAVPAQKAAAMPRDRDGIGRELQKELKRVGCYDGELNGVWSPPTRQAMKAFTDRVNATLPIDEPDSILLTMVRGYQDKVCGKPCPAGQGLSDGGRCMPTAILVRAPAKPGVPVVAAAPIAPAPVPATKPVPAITGWSTTTTASAPPPPTGAAPIDGRMALAGPATEAPPATPPAAAPAPAVAPRAAEKRVLRVESREGWKRGVFSFQGSAN